MITTMDDLQHHPDEELYPLSDVYSNNPNNPSSTNQVDSDNSDSSEDAEDDLRNFGIYQCLPVDQQDPDWDLEEPDTAEEYLRRVRFEANQLPAIVTNPPPLQLPPAPPQLHPSRLRIPTQDTALPECDPSMRPSIPWVRHFLATFDKLRRQLQKEEDCRAGRVDIDGRGGGGSMSIKISPAAMTESMRRKMQDMVLKGPSGSMKELKALRGLDQLTIQRRLTNKINNILARSGREVDEEENNEGQQGGEDVSMVEAIALVAEEEEKEEAAVPVVVVERNKDKTVESSHPKMTISTSTAQEIYALSVRLEKPIRADIAALYSALLKHCIKIRAIMGLLLLPDDPCVAYINILIVIAGGYFGQDKELSSVSWEEKGSGGEEEREEAEEMADLSSLL